MEIDDFIKELDKNLIVNKIEKENGMLLFHCSIKQVLTKCKYCNGESHSIHSRYIRTLSDLPIQNYKVKLILTVPKYFCNNQNCTHKTFAYPIEFAENNSIRTKRLDEYIYQIGLKNSSLDAKSQITDTHVSISNNTILRIVKKKQNQL